MQTLVGGNSGLAAFERRNLSTLECEIGCAPHSLCSFAGIALSKVCDRCDDVPVGAQH